jgi:TBC1 domain family protein 5
MTTCPFTTVLWRIFLHCLPRDSTQWNQVIDASRDEYNELVEKYLLDLNKIREHNGAAKHLNHPLSQEEHVIK